MTEKRNAEREEPRSTERAARALRSPEMLTGGSRAAQSARDQRGSRLGRSERCQAHPTARSPTSKATATQPSVSIPNRAPNARASGAPIATHQRTRYLSEATRVATPTSPPIHQREKAPVTTAATRAPASAGPMPGSTAGPGTGHAYVGGSSSRTSAGRER